MNRTRLTTRASLVAGTCALLGVVDVGAAYAANNTTHEFVYHSGGNLAAEVWFNSGTANLAKGRNSFTIKDDLCHDGWAVEVQYYRADNPTIYTSYESSDCTGSSWESSFSVAGAQPAPVTFYWRAGKWDVNGISADTWDSWIQTTIS